MNVADVCEKIAAYSSITFGISAALGIVCLLLGFSQVAAGFGVLAMLSGTLILLAFFIIIGSDLIGDCG